MERINFFVHTVRIKVGPAKNRSAGLRAGSGGFLKINHPTPVGSAQASSHTTGLVLINLDCNDESNEPPRLRSARGDNCKRQATWAWLDAVGRFCE